MDNSHLRLQKVDYYLTICLNHKTQRPCLLHRCVGGTKCSRSQSSCHNSKIITSGYRIQIGLFFQISVKNTLEQCCGSEIIFFGSGDCFGSGSGSGSCCRSCMKCVNEPHVRCAANSHFIPKITMRNKLLQNNY
jgi:hypothetical protein